ncbi:MAG: hypothetical protein ACO3AW_00700 [Chitinophagaceae bacterium]
MEPEVRQFLQRIVWTLSASMFWLLINTLAGLKFELAILDGNHIIGTIIFYCWLVLSFVLLIKLFKKLWSQHL